MSFATTLRRWKEDQFADCFSTALATSPFRAFFWECRPVAVSDLDDPFEYVLVDAPLLAGVSAEPEAFADHFSEDGSGIAVFPNIGGDAELIAPTPMTALDAYPHIAAFCRDGPQEQRSLLWRAVARAVAARVAQKPLWLSTSGLGVYWLHVRLDQRPKYYQFQEYRRWAGHLNE